MRDWLLHRSICFSNIWRPSTFMMYYHFQASSSSRQGSGGSSRAATYAETFLINFGVPFLEYRCHRHWWYSCCCESLLASAGFFLLLSFSFIFFRLYASLMSRLALDIMLLQRLNIIGIILILIYSLYWFLINYRQMNNLLDLLVPIAIQVVNKSIFWILIVLFNTFPFYSFSRDAKRHLIGPVHLVVK
jgi:hypothetical protein